MTVSLEQFVDRTAESSLTSRAEIQEVLDALPASRRPQDGEELARLLVNQKTLPAFQAQQFYAGKGKSLTLGNYVVLDKLGQGGVDTVLTAEHKRMKRVVAIKILSASVAVALFKESAAKQHQKARAIAPFNEDEAKQRQQLFLSSSQRFRALDLSASRQIPQQSRK